MAETRLVGRKTAMLSVI